MTRRSILVLGALAATVAAAATASILRARSASAAAAPSPPAPRTELEARTLDIGFYEGRVRRDSLGAADRATLALLYLQRGRESGRYTDFERAERSARAALRIRSTRNEQALAVLAYALLAQHRFDEALAVARRLCHDAREVAAYCALYGETQLEVGDYTGARATFAPIAREGDNLSVVSRLARLEEIEGRNEDARRLMARALVDVRTAWGTTAEQIAWFHLRAAELEMKTGHLARADSLLGDGLRLRPHDQRLLAARARLMALRHDWRAAIELAERAMAISVDPATLGLLSDAYLALGDTARAEEYATVMQTAVLQQPTGFHRTWGLFLLDRGRDADAVARNARREMAIRRDVYGYDLLAWSQYKLGRHQHARAAMLKALAPGTQDAMLFYHAGMIERALGRDSDARRYLEQAMTVNPHFHHTQAGIARAVLDSLRASAPEGAL